MTDELFLFLDSGASPQHDLLIQPGAAARSTFMWVPDVTAAATAARQAAVNGVQLIELYRGFDVIDAGQVVEAVGVTTTGASAVPVGLSTAYLIAGSSPSWSAAVYESPLAPAVGQRHTQQHGGRRTDIVWVPGERAIVDAVVDLARRGVELIEICGGTPLTTVAAAQRALRAASLDTPLVHVQWPFESLDGAFAYKASFTG